MEYSGYIIIIHIDDDILQVGIIQGDAAEQGIYLTFVGIYDLPFTAVKTPKQKLQFIIGFQLVKVITGAGKLIFQEILFNQKGIFAFADIIPDALSAMLIIDHASQKSNRNEDRQKVADKKAVLESCDFWKQNMTTLSFDWTESFFFPHYP